MNITRSSMCETRLLMHLRWALFALILTISIAHAEGLGTFARLDTVVDGESRPASMYVPQGYDESKAYPLIVFLHGSGERGDDGEGQTKSGIGEAIRANPDRFPCLVLMPQCSEDDSWVNPPGRNSSTAHAHITTAIEHAIDEFSVDEDRITLTGLSMGGGGTFQYGAANADRFAAFMPICGRGVRRHAQQLAKRPLWAFHGEEDQVIPITTSERMVEAIVKAGGKARLTRYPGVGHNSWDRAYSKDQGAIEWLLEQKRN